MVGADYLKLNMSTLGKYFLLAVRLLKLYCIEKSLANRADGVRVYLQGYTSYHK
jgi:hypothetical protein